MTYTFEHGEIRTDVENAKIGVGKDDGDLQDLLGVQVFVETAVYDNAARPLVAYHGGLFRPKATSGNTGPSTWSPGLWESVGGSSGGLNIDGTVATVPDLPAHPHGGDGTMYMVTSTGDLYIFHQHETPQWKDVGHIQGPPGPKGDTGVAGAAGGIGPKGDTGNAGTAGVKGDTGVAGAAGGIGPKGDTGNAGTAGVKGDTGVAGADSTVAGPKGDTGATGPAGDPLQIDNTLTGTDATKALGAPQGKVLDGKIAHNHTLITSNTSELGVNTGAIATNKTEITNNAARITQLSDGMHYVGNFHPTAAAEYPVPTGNHKNGSFWVIQGLGKDTLYHMSAGDLTGVDLADRDIMLWEEHAVSGKHWHVIGEAFDSHMLWEPGAHAGQIHNVGNKVGINTADPKTTLDVQGQAVVGSNRSTMTYNYHYSVGLVVRGNNPTDATLGLISGVGNKSEIWFGDVHQQAHARISYVGSSGDLQFVHGAQVDVTVKSNGNVGIGTDAPSTKLHVIGKSISLDGIVDESKLRSDMRFIQAAAGGLLNESNATVLAHRLYVSGSGWKNSTNTAGGMLEINNAGDISLVTSPAGTADGAASLSHRVRIRNSDGNVGIGIGTPTAKLHVQETVAHHTPIVVEPHEITTPGIVLKGNEGWKTDGVQYGQYRKFPDGTVEVKGDVMGDISGILPSGYRPKESIKIQFGGSTIIISHGGNFGGVPPHDTVYTYRTRFYADGN